MSGGEWAGTVIVSVLWLLVIASIAIREGRR